MAMYFQTVIKAYQQLSNVCCSSPNPGLRYPITAAVAGVIYLIGKVTWGESVICFWAHDLTTICVHLGFM